MIFQRMYSELAARLFITYQHQSALTYGLDDYVGEWKERTGVTVWAGSVPVGWLHLSLHTSDDSQRSCLLGVLVESPPLS